ncbi:MAG: hypothetical protein NXH75_03495 [Halobacteriovoraceae bacterium]|nr:hypothetical protein [Halobacteriovoraceae bacterium]
MKPIFTLFSLSLLIFTSCLLDEDKLPPVSDKSASRVMRANCIDCHQVYKNYTDDDFIFNELIIPGRPEASYLYSILKGASLGTKESMPPEGKLSTEDLMALKNWIKNVKTFPKPKNILSQYNIDPKRKMSEVQVLRRCYGQIVRKLIPKDHELVKEVLSKKITGAEACIKLLEKASLSDGSTVISEEGRDILQTFQSLHLSWFSELNFNNGAEEYGSFELYDPGSLAAYYTYSLFNPEQPFSKIFTSKKAIFPIRKSLEERTFLIFPNKLIGENLKVADYQFGSGEELKQKEEHYPAWNIAPVANGDIYGFKTIELGKHRIPTLVDSRKSLRGFRKQNIYHVNSDVFSSIGGGILGNPIYLLLNMKLPVGDKSDGGKHIPRSWGVSLFKDFLCRELPVTSITMAKKYQKKKSTHSFRREASCVQCHISMDGVSGIIRNLEINYSVDSGEGPFYQTSHIRKNDSTETITSPYGEGDKDFYKTKPTGRFVYKATSGTSYDKYLTSLDELGETLLQNNDLYKCVVKRYLKFFTGQEVQLFNTPPKSKKDIYVNYLMKKIARDFMNHQDLNLVIKEIIQSPIYQDRYYLHNL